MVYEKLKPLVTDKCPFVNLPETDAPDWGEILGVQKMKKCVWVRPKIVAVVEFSAEAQIKRCEVAQDSPAFHNLTGAIAAYGKAFVLLTALQQREEFDTIVGQYGFSECVAAVS
jgi:hypothetical protein